jgi:hypothetical protein
MSNALLYPITVSAKVVTSPAKVPSLSGDAFNRDAALEAGIHLHWALPDALTASTILSGQGSKSVIFPAVPDLWLVVRFNPGASSTTPLAKRTWSAWVVDSIGEIVTPLAQWTPPTQRDAAKVHTLAGVLPDASSIGHPGWGLWDTLPADDSDQAKTFDPMMAAYYPESRRRFGFYDSLQGAGTKGNVSYLVVGWFWTDKHDPLSLTYSPSHLLDVWKTATATSPQALSDLSAQVNFSAPAQRAPVWDVNIQVKAAPPPPPSKIDAIHRVAARAGSVDLQSKQLEAMKASFPVPAPNAAQQGAWAQVSSASSRYVVARETICHGSVVGVPLAGSSTAPVPIKNENVQLYPNVKRALADIASKSGQPDQVNGIEMLLADLNSQKYSTGGVIDMPGAAHAYTFQSVPGKATTFARIDVEAPPIALKRAPAFSIAPSANLVARAASGYWPELESRSAVTAKKSRIDTFPGIPVVHPPVQPPALTDAQKNSFVQGLQAAFQTAVAAAAAKGVTLDPRMVRIQDSRTNARSLSLGTTTDGSGSDSAGWWIDVTDTNAIIQLFTTTGGANVSMPFVDNLYDIPGPRWYRSWAPQVVLSNIGRSYKFGHNSRFRPDKKVQTRVSGNTLVSMTVSSLHPVFGSDILANPQDLNIAGVPSVVASLVRETLLLDTESAGTMASVALQAASPLVQAPNVAVLQTGYTNAIQGVLLARDSNFNSAVLKAIALDGEQPSPIAITPWSDPFDPMFIDSNYSHPHSTMDDWKLDTSDVEMTPVSPAATVPAAGQVETFTERSMLTATVVSVLESALLTRTVVDPLGRTIPVQTVDKSLTTDTFAKMDVISAALTKFDSQLFARDFRLRAGGLRLNQLEVIDMFGFPRQWNSGIPADSPAGDPSDSFWVPLPPRFPNWSRFNFRLMSATLPDEEANTVSGPVCGLLLPDFIEHALEVFDGEGTGLGQLNTDMPIHGVTAGATLQVTYTPHPWLDPDPDPFHHILDPTLKTLVQSLTQQSLVVPAGNVTWAETGLSAMLRTIDTIRGTFDPAAKTAERKVSLIGEPILVMGARLQFNGTSATATQDLAGDPPLLSAPPDMPTLDVRIGDVTRPDDGVLGLFLAGATPDAARFAPVTRYAADKALVNALATFLSVGWTPATHPFVKDQESLVHLPANQLVDVVILADVRNSLYATCGALPRKKITIPKDFVDSAVKSLEPSFYTGPILTTEQFGVEKALLPPPDVAGYSAEFLYEVPDATTYSSSQVPAAPPLSDLPKSRVLLTEGWLRMIPVKKS